MVVIMNQQNQLLCTFIDKLDLNDIVNKIQLTYNLAFGKIYILENLENENQLVLTYNAISPNRTLFNTFSSTISVHRKKQTNTIYTINAINKLIENKLGFLDKAYQINWEELRNSVLVTAYGELKIVNTKLFNIIKN
jgi:hypothetical protein